MRTSGGLQVVIALSLVVVALGPFVAGPVADDDAARSPSEPPEPEFVEVSAGDNWPSDSGEGTASVDEEVHFVAQLNEEAKIPPRVQRRYRTVYDREGARQLQGRARLSEVRSLSNEPGVGAVRIHGYDPVEDRPPAPGVSTIGADELHEERVTGEGVTVGVIDSGFQLNHPGIAGQVSAYRSFSTDDGDRHGTAVAGVVADTAPDAELYLAAVGPTTSSSEYLRVVNWLKAAGVDVIVDAGSYFAEPGGNGPGIEAIAENASDDVVFVTSAGNYAQRHWAGTPDKESRRIEFEPDVRENPLNDGDALEGRVTVSLRWKGSADYDLYLVRELPMGDVVVERSTGPQVSEDGGHERISTTLPRGRYHVAIRANGTPEDPPRLNLFASHSLAYGTATGSLTPPATSDGVIAVGAYSEEGVRPFSSRGPTADGDTGVDLVAPDDVRMSNVDTVGGTSFAAPYVAGTAALLKSANPSLTDEEVEELLLSGATDVGEEGPDPATGHGRVNATASLEDASVPVYASTWSFGRTPPVNETDPDAGATEFDGNAFAEVEVPYVESHGVYGARDAGGGTDLLIAWGGVVQDDERSQYSLSPAPSSVA